MRQEIEIHCRLEHPSIIKLYTFFDDANYIYLVLELAPNGTLQSFLKKKPSLSEFEAAMIFSQVVDGLQFLHRSNIMHRDISMSNLLLTADLRVKIADFGLASQLKQNYENKHTTLCGTPNYISPEVATRSSHGLPTDIWALGCLLYTLLVGRPPFDSNGVKSTLTQVVIRDVTFPDHISTDAQNLIKRMLSKNPEERIQLQEVASHAFMQKRRSPISTLDSGIMTLSSMGRSSRSRSEDRSIKQQHPVMDQVVETSSMYRYQSSSSINQQPHFNPSHHQHSLSNFLYQQPIRSPSLYQQISIPSFHQQQPSPVPSFHHHQQQHVQQSAFQLSPLESKEKKIQVSPLSSARLQPTRHKTKNAILHILYEPLGEVVLEFIKYKAKYGEERVHDVCRISSDGLRIVLYQPNRGKGVRVQDQPPQLPTEGADLYAYETLPEKHWKKYLYADRFVQMVQAKTPKVTFYSELAKCQLMENLEDFEMCLYKGGKVTKSGTSREFKLHCELNLNAMAQERSIIQHAEKCFQHCCNIEQTMSNMSLELSCFPIIIGRRPVDQETTKEIQRDNTFNNYISSSQTPLRRPKINMPSFSVEQTPSPSYRVPPLGLNNHRLPDSPPPTPFTSNQGKVTIQNIGTATYLSNGTVEIHYFDGNKILVLTSEDGGGIVFSSASGKSFRYNETDSMPDVVRTKFEQLPNLLQHLMTGSNDMITSTPAQQPPYNPVHLSSRLNQMKFIR